MNKDAANNKDGGHGAQDEERMTSTVDTLHMGWTPEGIHPVYSTIKATNATLLTNLQTTKLWCEESSRIDFDQKVDVFIWGNNWFLKI